MFNFLERYTPGHNYKTTPNFIIEKRNEIKVNYVLYNMKISLRIVDNTRIYSYNKQIFIQRKNKQMMGTDL